MPAAPPSASRLWPLLAGAAGLGGAALGLSLTNPPPNDFENFAGDQLVELAVEEVCGEDGLPMPLRLVVQNCPELIRSQSQVLGALARQGTTRHNFGIFSLYKTALGGQEVLPFLRIPRYQVTTFAGAGQFVILSTSKDGREGDAGGATSDARP
ncbi:DUF4359 domain-containing protein [Synechococcus sp. ATX 2A4]|uniref:DUF4359 domain-containing protein n=1 Tax=Synechococcus sp. ATX 2A4 TaxID=2823727 RepID=UPI0020CD8A4F|nr:DUF4359 domain-containing protein [Synechococcus sp. ATX 2A4]